MKRTSKVVSSFLVTLVTFVLAGCATTPLRSFAFDVTDPANDASASPEVTRMFGFVDGDEFVVAVTFATDVVEDDVVGLVAIDSDGDPSTFVFEGDQTAAGEWCGGGTADYEVVFDTIDETARVRTGVEVLGVAQSDWIELDSPVWENLLGARRLVVRIPGSLELSDATEAVALFGNGIQPTDCVPGGGVSW